MRKIILYIASSIDGFIADKNGKINWLYELENPNKIDHNYGILMDSIDTVIMGRNIYNDILGFGVEWPYKDKKCFVITNKSNNVSIDKSIEFVSENFIDFIKNIKSENGKDIWLVGGGNIISQLLNEDLIDEIQLCIIPTILGDGIKLFPNNPKASKWELTSSEKFETGAIMLTYKLK